MIARLAYWCRFALTTLLIWLVRVYQVVVRPVLPAVCRFSPSCSEYMILAVQKYGPAYGFCKGVWRICRCNPFSRGGDDPP
jgi:putative membrane protein insertion efficiency factor